MEGKDQMILSLKQIVKLLDDGERISIDAEDADREQAFKPNGKMFKNIYQIGYMTIIRL